jgi:hypothetical protein
VIVKKHRRLVVRMGQYETHEFYGEAVIDTNNEDDRALMIGYAEADRETRPLVIANFLDDTLQEILATDVAEASFNTAEEDSFIHEYHKNNALPTKER